MVEKLEESILEFIENRHKKGEGTASRHVHIRFGLDIPQVEKILETMREKTKISKYYDKNYQEDRFTPVQ
jgi:hypothetical protein